MTPGALTFWRRRLLAGIALGVWAGAVPAAPPDPFPMGARLRPRVEFWKLVYSRVTSDQALLHDADDLGVIYQIVSLEGRHEWRDIERFIQPIRERIADTLRGLAEGAPAETPGDAAAILAKFGPAPTPERLRRAADNVRFQRGQADAFLEGLVRRGAYEPHLRRIFRAEGLPYDLTYLPHVESSFRPHAFSRSGAAGIWQFTRSTGRHYLRISSLSDERWDPVEATRGAARLLRRNYGQLGAWPVAITAYNHGLEGMKRAVARTGTRDLEEIIERYEGRAFGFASKNFYAEFLAAREIAGDSERYFGPVPRWPALLYREVRLDRPRAAPDLMRALGLSICDLTHYNPSLRPVALAGEKPLPAGYALKVPLGLLPEGASIAALFEALERPSLLAAGPRRSGRAGAAAPAPPPWIAALTLPPSPGPAGRGSSFLLDSALLWGHPGRSGPAPLPRLAGRVPAAPPGPVPVSQPAPAAASPAAPAPGPVALGAVRTASAPPLSPWRWLGTSLGDPLRLHPDWHPSMRSGEVGLPPTLGLSALRVTGGRIRVEPEENLRLIAFWLGVPAARLRRLNALRPGESLRLGQWLRPDFSRVSEEEFLERRLLYQRELAAGFLHQHRVTSTRVHQVRRGDTLWSISRRYGRVPLWLLRWYNDRSDWLEPGPGTEVVVPVIERLAS